jgi:TRAP-type mannitol/chloroaromatic compound transport system substrate-binding protein
VYKWKCQTYAVPGSVAFRAQELGFKFLKDATAGRLDVKLHGPGSIVGPFEALDAQTSGILEMGINAPAYYAGKDPGFAAFFNLNNLWQNSFEAQIWVNYYGGREIAKRAYAKYNVLYIGPVMMSNEAIMSKVPLRKLADFKGIKIRTTGGISSSIFEKLGARPVPIPGGEIYSALDTGIVDAAEWITLADNWDIGLHEVTKFVLYPSFHAPTDICDLTVSMKVWKSLSPDLQAAIEMAVHQLSNLTDCMGEAESIKTMRKMKDKGLTHTQLSPEEWKNATKLSWDVAEGYRKKSPLANEIITSVVNYLKQTGKLE